ncbi:glycosyltransferase [Nevskia soli]|uniref:glycosyltransferase n=1 Tax=Nevskia soli TaxID=418856 RepID=UPI0015D72E19|nr:glycosyltransferase [Nevskia soli]
MKIIHLPFCYYPDPVGGTEIYVAGLAREQQRQGCTPIVCAPAQNESRYYHDGVEVRRFALEPATADVADLYGSGDALAASWFGRVLDQQKPDLVHLHAFTRGASLKDVHEAKRRGIPTVFSYHTPTVSCIRGTLLKNGSEVCDGILTNAACASCNLQSLGVPGPLSQLIGRIPTTIGRAMGRARLTGKIATSLRMTELVEYRHSAFHTLMRDVDCVIAHCNWTRDILLRNGVPEDKIAVSRQGLSGDLTFSSGPKAFSRDLRVAFLGRLSPEKGLHILVDALRHLPTVAIRLDIFGLCQSESDIQYRRRLSSLLAGDQRVSFRTPLSRQELVPTLRNYDLVAVPSQWLETGPMVVMEAFAAGVPVIGSRLGGIAELVDHEVNGLLIEPASVQHWADALLMLSENRKIAARLCDGIRKQRTMRDVVREINGIYSNLLPAAQMSVAFNG